MAERAVVVSLVFSQSLALVLAPPVLAGVERRSKECCEGTSMLASVWRERIVKLTEVKWCRALRRG